MWKQYTTLQLWEGVEGEGGGYDKQETCHIYPKYSDRQVCPNNVDPDQMPQNVASDQGLHCLSTVLDISTIVKLTFKFQDKYGKELWCPNIKC